MLGNDILSGSAEEKMTKDLLISIQTLQQNLDRSACLIVDLSARLEQKQDPGLHAAPSRPGPGEIRLREAIREAIDVLDESRRSFKSKRLEMLRRQLTDVLMEKE